MERSRPDSLILPQKSNGHKSAIKTTTGFEVAPHRPCRFNCTGKPEHPHLPPSDRLPACWGTCNRTDRFRGFEILYRSSSLFGRFLFIWVSFSPLPEGEGTLFGSPDQFRIRSISGRGLSTFCPVGQVAMFILFLLCGSVVVAEEPRVLFNHGTEFAASGKLNEATEVLRQAATIPPMFLAVIFGTLSISILSSR